MSVTINESQRLFVIPSGGGFSCLGFDVCSERVERLYRELNSKGITFSAAPEDFDTGSLSQYDFFKLLQDKARESFQSSRKKFLCELSPQLVGLEGKRVEVVDNFGEKRRFIVGRSTGWIPIHIEVKQRNSSGGGGADRSYKSVRVIR